MAEAGEDVLRLTVGEHDNCTDVSILGAMAASAAAAVHVRVAMTIEDAAFEEALVRLVRFAGKVGL